MNLPRHLANWLMVAGFAICLLQIWVPVYFVTGDGPCHIYNAQIIHDLLANKNTEFYNNFYLLSYVPNPNWLSHTVLALLMFVVNGVIAEKLLITGYIFLFITGFTALLKRLGNNNSFLPLLSFVFVFNCILVKGFYNFSFSIAIFFWVVEIWLRYMDRKRIGTLVLFFFLALFLFFTHPMAFAFGCFSCFALTCSVIISASVLSLREKIISIARYLIVLLLCFLPGIVLFFKFMSNEGGTGNIHLYIERYRIDDLLHNNYLVSYTSREEFLVKGLAYLLCILFLLALFFRLRKGFAIQKYDGFLLTCALAGYVYLFFPDSLLGGGAFSVRAHYLLFLIGSSCIALLMPSDKIKTIFGIVLFSCFIALSVIRFPCQLSASRAVIDLVSSSKYIKPYSVLFPLDFSGNGKDEKGNIIADRNWLFSHAPDYMATQKPLIILDNYEANVGYFPLCWRPNINPYHYLGRDGGMERMPPYAFIRDYKKTCGVTINYILMWCYEPSWLKDDQFRTLYAEIIADYHLVYTSSTGRTALFEKN